ncbi:MAG: YceI family protein [Myxococcales bacterium]
MTAALALALSLAAPSPWNLDSGRSKVSYHLVHKLHEFTGTDDGKLRGKAQVRDDGTALVEVVGQTRDFSSGNGNRDEHMLETVEAEKYPQVLVRAKMQLPAGLSGAADGTAKVKMTLHGQDQTVEVPLHVAFSGNSAHVTGAFNASVEGFGIKRPQLLFVPIDDAMKITVDVWFTRAGS